MVKYIQALINELKSRIAGMKANPTKWASLPITVETLESYVAELETQSAKIDAAEALLQKEREIGRKLTETYRQKQKQVDNLAYGIHADSTELLSTYGLTLRQASTPKPTPGKCTITSIVDDSDGEGFVLVWNSLAEADHYEIEKGEATNTSDLVLAPPYPFLKSTAKISLTDDNVVKGRRYFYRVRAVNASGTGEWSEPVNKVQ